ncbi:MAG: peptide chain release factor N(5)-glutamine methyltransferase [Bacillota bacterium]
MGLTVKGAAAWAARVLEQAGVDDPVADAQVLMGWAMGRDRWLALLSDEPVDGETLSSFRRAVTRRAARLPLQYITGQREFMSLELEVTPATLVPRPETEDLVERALDILAVLPPAALVADIGTGCGNIAVSVAVNCPRAQVHAVDVSPGALAVASGNAARHGVADRIRFHRGDLLQPLLEPGLSGRFDLILANLPYLSTREYRQAPPEVRHEPVLALDGGRDGLTLYRRFARYAAVAVRPGGSVLAEIGWKQGPAMLALWPLHRWSASVHLDRGGRPRVLEALLRQRGGVPHD